MKRYTQTELRLLICCFAAYTAAYLSRCNLSPSLDAISHDFGISTAMVGLLPTLFSIPYAGGQILTGLLADRLPAHRLIFAGLLGSAALNILFSVGEQYGLLLGIWFVNGLLQSMIWTPIMRIFAIHFRESVRERALFTMSLTMIFGYLFAWTLSGLLTSFFSWRVAFRVSGLCTATVAVISLKGMTGTDVRMQIRTTDNQYTSERCAPLGQLLFRTNLLLILLCCVGNGYVRDSIMNWAAKLLIDTQGIDLSGAVGVILIIPAVSFAGIRFGEVLYWRVKGNPYISSVALFLLCTICSGMLTAGLGISMISCIALLAVCAAVSYGLNPILTSILPLRYLSLNRVALAAGLMDAMIYAGSAFSGAFAGFLSDRHGWVAVFVSWTVMSMISVISAALANRFDCGQKSHSVE